MFLLSTITRTNDAADDLILKKINFFIKNYSINDNLFLFFANILFLFQNFNFFSCFYSIPHSFIFFLYIGIFPFYFLIFLGFFSSFFSQRFPSVIFSKFQRSSIVFFEFFATIFQCHFTFFSMSISILIFLLSVSLFSSTVIFTLQSSVAPNKTPPICYPATHLRLFFRFLFPTFYKLNK